MRRFSHDAALAIGHADFVQDICDMDAELLEPSIGRAAGLAGGEDQGIILVHGEQALTAAGRAEHGQRVGTRRG